MKRRNPIWATLNRAQTLLWESIKKRKWKRNSLEAYERLCEKRIVSETRFGSSKLDKSAGSDGDRNSRRYTVHVIHGVWRGNIRICNMWTSEEKKRKENWNLEGLRTSHWNRNVQGGGGVVILWPRPAPTSCSRTEHWNSRDLVLTPIWKSTVSMLTRKHSILGWKIILKIECIYIENIVITA